MKFNSKKAFDKIPYNLLNFNVCNMFEFIMLLTMTCIKVIIDKLTNKRKTILKSRKINNSIYVST